MKKDSLSNWTFLTNHAHVLLCLSKSPDMRMRDIAQKVGITERAVQKIIADLESGGYIEIQKEGRCNTYTPHKEKHLRHPIESQSHVEDLLNLVSDWKDDSESR